MKHSPPTPPELGNRDGLSYALFRPDGDPPAGVVIVHGADSAKESHFDFARNLRDAVAELPESQRTALRLAKLEDLSLAEASARSGLSIGALKVATHRAMHSLRRRFGADEKGRFGANEKGRFGADEKGRFGVKGDE